MAAGSYRPHSASTYSTDASLGLGAHGIALRMVGTDRDVLELGCATGSVTKELAGRRCRVTAIEIDPDGAQAAKEWAEEVVVGDLDVMDLSEALGDASFDVIIAADVLEHLRDPSRCLRACLAHLRPAGEVVLSIPNIAHADVRLSLLQGSFEYQQLGLLDETHLRFFTRASLEHFLDDNGLVALEWERVVMAPGTTEVKWGSDLSSDVVEWVSRQPDADTYQFVLRAAYAPSGSHLREVGAQRDAVRRRLQGVEAQLREADGDRAGLQQQLTAARAELDSSRQEVAAAAGDRDRGELIGAQLGATRAELAAARQELAAVRDSESYRLGNAIVAPFALGRRLVGALRRRLPRRAR